MSSPASRACARATSSESVEGSTPVTAQPSRANSSASSPPPQPTSRIRRRFGSCPRSSVRMRRMYPKRDGLSALLRTFRKPSSSHHVWLRRSYISLSTGMGTSPRTNADRTNRIRPPPPSASAARPELPRPAAHPRSTASPRRRLAALVARIGATSRGGCRAKGLATMPLTPFRVAQSRRPALADIIGARRGVNRGDDPLSVDALQVDARRADVGVPELALDHVERHALARELDCVGVAQLVRREAAPDTRLAGEPANLDARVGARPRPPAGRAVDDAEQRPDRQRDPGGQPRSKLLPPPGDHSDHAPPAALAVAHKQRPAPMSRSRSPSASASWMRSPPLQTPIISARSL